VEKAVGKKKAIEKETKEWGIAFKKVYK